MKEYIVIIEDNPLLRESWRILKQFEQHRFACFEDALKSYKTNPGLFTHAKFITVDFYYDEVDSNYDGFSIAKEVRRMAPDTPMFLASDGDFGDREEINLFDRQISKSPKTAWETIQSRLP